MTDPIGPEIRRYYEAIVEQPLTQRPAAKPKRSWPAVLTVSLATVIVLAAILGWVPALQTAVEVPTVSPVADEAPQVANDHNEFVPPFAFPSRLVEDEVGPLQWVWREEFHSVEEGGGPHQVLAGEGCAREGPHRDSPEQKVVFKGDVFFVTVGVPEVPDISLAESDGSRVDLGNPFGPDEWVCNLSHNEDVLLAVGSRVWWSEDVITWYAVEAFDAVGGLMRDGGSARTADWYTPGAADEADDQTYEPSPDVSRLAWSGSGPLGFVVLGSFFDSDGYPPYLENDGWYSVDLESWFRIAPEAFGRFHTAYGPSGIHMTEEFIAVGANEGVWVGTPDGAK